MAIFCQSHLVINVVAPQIIEVILMSVVTDGLYQNNQAGGVVDPRHTTVIRKYVVTGKSIGRKLDPAVVLINCTTLRCLCAAMDGYSVNGVDHHAVDHETITVKAIYAATVILFVRFVVCRRVVVQRRIIQAEPIVAEVVPIKEASTFAVLADYCPRATAPRVAVPSTMIHLVKYAAVTSFYQNRVALIVVVPTITTIRHTFAAVTISYRDHQVQRVADPLTIIDLNTHAAEIMFTQNHLALLVVHCGVCGVAHIPTEFL